MILDVDLGNSRIKWRFSDRPGEVATFHFGDDLPRQWRNLTAADHLRLASVLKPEKTSAFIASVQRQCDVNIRAAEVQQNFAGLQLAYADVSRFGVDRWLALLALRARYADRDCVVLSGGTALTVDLLNAQGEHLGGYIAPGWRASAQALWQNTDGLDEARRELAPFPQPGATTLECIAAGLTLLYRGFTSELSQWVVSKLQDPLWVITGGDAQILLGLMGETLGAEGRAILPQVLPNLVLDGLSIALPDHLSG